MVELAELRYRGTPTHLRPIPVVDFPALIPDVILIGATITSDISCAIATMISVAEIIRGLPLFYDLISSLTLPIASIIEFVASVSAIYDLAIANDVCSPTITLVLMTELGLVK